MTFTKRWLVLVALACSSTCRAAEPPPNFVFFLAEAQGWSSLSSPSDDQTPNSRSEVNLTPNLDRLAREGTRFAQAYAPSPRCTPSRASFLTGKSPAQLHMTFVHTNPGETGSVAAHKLLDARFLVDLPESEVTIAAMLKRQGYATAHYGKWHLGRGGPARHGFDESDGSTGNEGLTNHPEETDRMTDRGVAFITKQFKSAKPFYLQISYYPARGADDVMAATVAAVRQRLKGKADGRGGDIERRAVQVAANQNMDESVGRVLKTLDDLHLADNTYVIFSADHGSQGRNANAPLSAGKGTLWEGGIRVPLLFRGPGIAPNTVSHVACVGWDLLPTIADLAHLNEPLPKGVEGASLSNVLQHAGTGLVKRPRDALVFHFPHYDMDDSGPAAAIVLGDYKLIHFFSKDTVQLYDLKHDLAERKDLARDTPAKAAELKQKLTTYLKEVNAQLPTPNPNFDPTKARELVKPR